MNMEFERKLTIPMEVKKLIPVSDHAQQVIATRGEQLKRIFRGEDSRFLLIVGPCSADNEQSVMDYLSRLQLLQQRVQDKIFIVPRLYTNKPRTQAESYRGMFHQPDPLQKPDLLKGIMAIRRLHLRAVEELNFTCADEMLYPENHRYIDDILGYVAVGARSVENQQHRLTASGIEVPVGLKNPMNGDLSTLVSAVATAQCKHTFLYRGWEVHSQGNPYAHAILRGFVDEHGEHHPNYQTDYLLSLCHTAQEVRLNYPAVVVDANHSNSGKDPQQQGAILKSVLRSRQQYPELKTFVKGAMVESYLQDGNQPVDGGEYGKSITDACLGWAKTERLILELADTL